MKVDDRVYGLSEVGEPVLLELINSRPIQRLKKINQAGASQYVFKDRDITRYEHSLGVAIFLGRMRASLEEQVAGLLHDVSHTAFSHVVDFVFTQENHSHDFHEKFYDEVILSSEIPKILKRNGLSIERILDESNFPLLESDLPNLCADRIDYSLREMVRKDKRRDKVQRYLSNFLVLNDEIVMKNKDVARDFAEDYLRMDRTVWSNPFEVVLFQILADAIKVALKDNIITKKDLFETDEYVYRKLADSGNQKVLEKLNLLSPNLTFFDDPKYFDFYSRTKFRYVNPRFVDSDGYVKSVIDVFPEFVEKVNEHKKAVERGIFAKIVFS